MFILQTAEAQAQSLEREVQKLIENNARIENAETLWQTVKIPMAKALRCCQEIQAEHAGQWYHPAMWRCQACVALGRDPSHCHNVLLRYVFGKT